MTVAALEHQPADGREAARMIGRYAKPYARGGFATPTAAELEKAMATGGWHWWPGVAAVSRRLARPSTRVDFTGRRYLLRAGARVISHLACAPDATLPNLEAFHWIYSYVEDEHVTAQLKAQGRGIRAIQVSASSEIKACWGWSDDYTYDPVDLATLVRIPASIPDDVRAEVLGEIKSINTWHDDFPFYSDGSWDAVSLRGFNPADPSWGVKPAEMSKSWWATHPDAARYDRCDWTTLADRCPATVGLVKALAPMGELERVRLLRMAGRDGKGGRLGRHCDITDRAAGTRNGQIIRFHIPLITHPDITMSAWNAAGRHAQVHLPAWSMWYLDARKPHAVDNRAGIDRIHLVFDVQASEAARQLVLSGTDLAA